MCWSEFGSCVEVDRHSRIVTDGKVSSMMQQADPDPVVQAAEAKKREAEAQVDQEQAKVLILFTPGSNCSGCEMASIRM